ncbi:Cation efflux protein cytoplasmic domain-containing protein [Plasmodiophora brassicae]
MLGSSAADSVPFPSLTSSRSSSSPATTETGSSTWNGGAVRRQRIVLRWTRAVQALARRVLGHDQVSLARFSRTALNDDDSKSLALYLVMTYSVMAVQFLSGCMLWNIGLVAVSLTKLFDSTVLVASLAAMMVSKRPPDSAFSFGYGRFEVLASFTTSCFLLFNAFFTCMESLHVLLTNAPISMHRRVVFEVIGLVVNAFGAYRFTCGRLGEGVTRSGARQANLHCVYLYILCDALSRIVFLFLAFFPESSLSYLLSAICNACVAIYLVWPVFIHTSLTLLQARPTEEADALRRCIRDISAFDGVLECRTANFWSLVPGDLVGTLHVRIRSDASEAAVLDFAHTVLAKSARHPTIQIDKDSVIE